MGMTNTQHTCTIRTTSFTSHPDTNIHYSVLCAVCGTVGQTQMYEVDAQAIAERHESEGGFERFYAAGNSGRPE